jgi:Glyoxalase-like domain
MTNEWQLVIDCADPERLVRFWAVALGYVPAPPPDGHATWREYYLSIGVPEDELGDGDALDRLVDPSGRGPAIWFQQVPERKTLKNRLHIDLKVGGGRSVALTERRSRVDALIAELSAAGATAIQVNDLPEQGHYAVLMADPEGNEFDVV